MFQTIKKTGHRKKYEKGLEIVPFFIIFNYQFK